MANGWATPSELKVMHPHDLWLMLEVKSEEHRHANGEMVEDEINELLEMLHG